MGKRDAAFAAVKRRLDQAISERRLDLLVTREAEREGARLARVIDAESDIEAAQQLGLFHWLRYHALPPRFSENALASAVRFYEPVYRARPMAVPEPLREYFESEPSGPVSPGTERGAADGVTDGGRRAIDLLHEYDRTGALPLLSESIRLMRVQAGDSRGGRPDRTVLSNLGAALWRLFERTGETDTLVEAVDFGRAALDGAPAGAPGLAADLSNVAGALRLLFERTRQDEYLLEAIEVGRAAVAELPTGDAGLPAYMNNLGLSLRLRYEESGDIGLLEELVTNSRAACAAVPAGHPERAMYSNNLGVHLRLLAERRLDTALMIEAVGAARTAVSETSAGHPDLPGHHANLATALLKLSELTDDAYLLTESLIAARAAAGAASAADRPLWLSNLSTILRTAFDRTGQAAYLTEAVGAGRSAFTDTGTKRADNAGVAATYVGVLLTTFEHTGEKAYLDEAVQVGRGAVSLPTNDQHGRLTCLNNLSLALRLLSGHPGYEPCLVEALEVGRAGLESLPTDHPDRHVCLLNLAIVLRTLHERTEDESHEAYLNEAREVARAAVEGTPVDHPDLPWSLNVYAAVLQSSYNVHESLETLDELVEVARRIAAFSRPDHPDSAMYLHNLAAALRTRFVRTSRIEALIEARECFRQAAENPAAPILIRVSAYRHFAGLAARDSAYISQALDAVEAAVELLPQLASGGLSRSDRMRRLEQASSLAGVAAATAVLAGRTDRAAELLEATRGLLADDVVDAQSPDLQRLQAVAPNLFETFGELRGRRAALERGGAGSVVDGMALTETFFGDGSSRSGSGELSPSGRESLDAAAKRRAAAGEWDALVAEIRSVAGLERFLRLASVEELTAQAAHGPVIYVYTSDIGGGAIVLTGDGETPARKVPLAALSEAAAHEQVRILLTANETVADRDSDPLVRRAAQQRILDVLAWTWDTIAGPILEGLGYTAARLDGDPWPRVWWCPVGILGYLPLHTAGHHTDSTSPVEPGCGEHARTVLERVVSSYTTTVRALGSARERRPRSESKMLIVAAPGTSGTSAFAEEVDAEVEALLDLVPDALVLRDPVPASVLERLPGCPVVHFSCHGVAQWSDPERSGLVLQLHPSGALTFSDIRDAGPTGALVYLSACETNDTPPRLIDEAVHIAGAFHSAGYLHVVGNLWPIDARAAYELAAEFYTDLTRFGSVMPETHRSGQALHDATRRLRDAYPRVPTHWAGSVHLGI